MPITETINNYVRYYAQTDATDPRKIPAKLHLEGLGTIDYKVSTQDVFGGKTHRIRPTDSERTFYYVRAPYDTAPRINQPIDDKVNRVLALGCMLGAMIGMSMLTAASFVTSPALIVSLAVFGTLISFASIITLMAHDPEQQRS